MESGDSRTINGAANGFSPENSPEEEVNNSSDEELGTPKGSEEGSDETIKNLHHEIHSLRLNRSDLHRQIEELKDELEKSDASANALAAHASYLEGELIRTQEDLSAAMATAEDASDSVKILEKSKDDLELERGRKEGEIRVLRAEVRVLKSKAEEMDKLLKDVTSKKSELEVKIAAMDSEARDAVEAEVKIRVLKEEEMGRVMLHLREKNSELGGTVSNYEARFSREEVLENTLKKLVDRNTELERKVGELALTVPGVSWGTTAAVAASTGAVAIVATAFYLRRPR